jgi:hypothetical protein
MDISQAFLKKLKTVEEAIAADKGDFVLFGVVQREGSVGLWDLLVSAPWFGANETDILAYLVQRLKATLTPAELLLISRIILLPPQDPRVQHIVELAQRETQQPVRHTDVHLVSWTLSNMSVSTAHIITALSPQTPSGSVSVSFPSPPRVEANPI